MQKAALLSIIIFLLSIPVMISIKLAVAVYTALLFILVFLITLVLSDEKLYKVLHNTYIKHIKE